MTYANNFDPDEAPQNVWHSNYISAKYLGGNIDFFASFERKKYLKKLPSMQRVKNVSWPCQIDLVEVFWMLLIEMGYAYVAYPNIYSCKDT